MPIKDEMSMNEQKQVMPIDREVVIRELTQHIARADNIEDGLDGLRISVPMLRGALELLKAQEPVKPVPAINDVGDWWCGNCYQSVVGEEELDVSGLVPIKFNFCPNCGREVKWG